MTVKEALAIIEYYSTLNEIGQDEKQLDFDNALRFIKQALEELDELKKSDESKEQSSIDYYNEMRKYKRELEELKKDITRFLYLQTGRIPFTGEFTQEFIIENNSHPLAHEYVVECTLKKEYRNLKNKLIGLVGGQE